MYLSSVEMSQLRTDEDSLDWERSRKDPGWIFMTELCRVDDSGPTGANRAHFLDC